jgi:hypothetical protein
MWIITKDCGFDPELGLPSRVGWRSCDCPDKPDTKGWRRFKLKNDDGETDYEGLADDWQSEDAFAPLDDLGTPDAGSTEIHFYDPTTKKWEQL